MRAHRSLTLLIAAVAGCSTTPPPDLAAFSAFKNPADATAPIRNAAHAVVRIATANSYATGSFVSADGLLLTNNHVLGVQVCPREGCYATISQLHQRDEPYSAPQQVFVQPLHVDAGLDIAVVQVYTMGAVDQPPSGKLSTPNYLSFNSRGAADLVGSHINVVGHPEGRLKKWTTGDVTDSDGTWFWSSAFILPGNSGSPILDDNGQIVGIVHRGPTGEDLLTHDGVNEYAIGTASASIIAALSQPLPGDLLSVTAPTTDDDVLKNQIIYRNAHVPLATVNNVPKPIVDTLAQACDAGLARSVYASPEDLASALAGCDDAIGWIDCSASPAPGTWGYCPSNAQAWNARFSAEVEHWRAFNGNLDFGVASFARVGLFADSYSGFEQGKEGLQTLLDETQPPLDFALVPYLVAFGLQSYRGTNLVDYVRAYNQVPHYEESMVAVANSALWLTRTQQMSTLELRNFLNQLYHDDRVSLGSKLFIEEAQYNWMVLPPMQ